MIDLPDVGIGCIKSTDTNNMADYWYRLVKWADTIDFFCSVPLNEPIPIIAVYLWYQLFKWDATKYFYYYFIIL
jgi:hypothetical protein